MCKHCKDLKDDKEVVHKFMELAAMRISSNRKEYVSVDDLEITISFRPLDPVLRLIYKDLKDMNE